MKKLMGLLILFLTVYGVIGAMVGAIAYKSWRVLGGGLAACTVAGYLGYKLIMSMDPNELPSRDKGN